jgi:hypothetical protein
MALEHTLYLATSREPDEVLAWLSGLSIGLDPTPPLHLAGRGVTVVAIPVTSTSRQIIHEAFTLAPTVTVIFRLNKLEHTNEGRRTMLRAALHLLEETDGVLLFESEIPLCQALHGHLTLNADNDLWNDRGYLTLVTIPYNVAPLANL